MHHWHIASQLFKATHADHKFNKKFVPISYKETLNPFHLCLLPTIHHIKRQNNLE